MGVVGGAGCVVIKERVVGTDSSKATIGGVNGSDWIQHRSAPSTHHSVCGATWCMGFPKVSCALVMILCALITCVLAIQPAMAEIYPPEGPARSATFADVKPRTHDDRLTFEEWAFAVHLDDGTRIYITYALSHVWFLPPVCLTEVSVVNKGTEALLYGHRESADVFNIKDNTLHFGPGQEIYLDHGNGGHLRAQSDWHDDVSLRFDIQSPYPGIVVGDGWYSVGNDSNARVWSAITYLTRELTEYCQLAAKIVKSVVGWLAHITSIPAFLINYSFTGRFS